MDTADRTTPIESQPPGSRRDEKPHVQSKRTIRSRIAMWFNAWLGMYDGCACRTFDEQCKADPERSRDSGD